MTTTTLSRVIPWLDRFQRGRGVEGDVMLLGLGDGAIFSEIGDQIQQGDRLVVVDTVGPFPFTGERGLITRVKTELVVIDEDPRDVLGTEAMDLEHGGYRMVSINGSRGEDDTMLLLGEAASLICPGGLVMLTPWPGDPEVDRGIVMGYWEYLRTHPKPLMRCGHEGQTLLLTNDRVWQKDYEAVIAASKDTGDDDPRSA